MLEGARRIVGPAGVIDGLQVSGELRRERARDGSASIIAHGAARLEPPAPGVRVEPLSLEDLFIEVTR